MGSKYTTQAASGFNSSPPPDDGSQNASNLITWSGIKAKLADPTKNLADAINTALVSAFDYSVRQITTSDTVLASDHMKTVEIAPTATSGVTVTLADAATMTNNFRVFVKNSSAFQQTIARATGGDTIEGSAANITIPPKGGYIFQTTTGADGYIIIGDYPLEITNLTEDTAPAVSDLVAAYDVSASQLKKVTIEHFYKTINGLTEDTSPVASTDYVVTYDASASAAKKVKLSSVSGLTLIATQTASTSASLDFTSGIDSTYDEYVIEFVDLLPATNDVDLGLRMSTDAGSTFDSTAIYGYSNTIQASANRATDSGTYIEITRRTSNTANGGGVSGEIHIYAPSGAKYKHVTLSAAGNGWTGAADTALSSVGGGQYRSTTAVNAFRLLFSSGNISSGKALLYGMRKT